MSNVGFFYRLGVISISLFLLIRCDTNFPYGEIPCNADYDKASELEGFVVINFQNRTYYQYNLLNKWPSRDNFVQQMISPTENEIWGFSRIDWILDGGFPNSKFQLVVWRKPFDLNKIERRQVFDDPPKSLVATNDGYGILLFQKDNLDEPDEYQMWISSDGWYTKEKISMNSTLPIARVNFSDHLHGWGWAVDERLELHLFYTEDGGSNWVEVQQMDWNRNTVLIPGIHDDAFVLGNEGLYYTTNGGKSFEFVPLPESPWSYLTECFDNRWIGGNKYSTFTSSDALNWERIGDGYEKLVYVDSLILIGLNKMEVCPFLSTLSITGQYWNLLEYKFDLGSYKQDLDQIKSSGRFLMMGGYLFELVAQ